MHSFLKSIGFSSIKNQEQFQVVCDDIIANPTFTKCTLIGADTKMAQIEKDYGEDFGITLIGEYSKTGALSVEYYFPFIKSTINTHQEKIYIEKHGDKEAFSGVSEDYSLGMTLIFFLQNVLQYKQSIWMNNYVKNISTVSLAALASSGKIILDVKKITTKPSPTESERTRQRLVEAARHGDKAAMENLTLEDMDTYSTIGKRTQREDILSIVNTSFMPYGIETEHYSVIGNILESKLCTNSVTHEEVYIMVIETNNIKIKVIINKADLLGEPASGRRFKGIIWLQGSIPF